MLAVVCTALVATHVFHWLVAGLLIVAMVLHPSSPAPMLLVIGIGTLLLISSEGAYSPKSFALVLGVHLLASLHTISTHLTPTARVEVRLLVEALPPILSAQALVQPVAWLASWLTSKEVTVAWLPALTITLLAVMAWAFLLVTRKGASNVK